MPKYEKIRQKYAKNTPKYAKIHEKYAKMKFCVFGCAKHSVFGPAISIQDFASAGGVAAAGPSTTCQRCETKLGADFVNFCTFFAILA